MIKAEKKMAEEREQFLAGVREAYRYVKDHRPKKFEKGEFRTKLAKMGWNREPAEVSSVQFVFFSFCHGQLRRRTVLN